METAISTLSQLPLTKEQQKSFSQKLTEEIISGEVDPIKAEILLKSLEETIKSVRGNIEIKRIVVDEVERNGNKVEMYGAEVSVSSRKTYMFESSEDSEWEQLDSQIKSLTERKKARETFLKAIPGTGTVDPNTGEIINAPTYTAAPVITVKFK
ncbi:MAG: hypothetical protein PHU98_06270 [Mariniphaga sp.]|nr:hypothetical protein [Paludibacter sp.]MDD4225976.1 hypothetical protein [Mariniphaga sp.]